MNAELMEFIGDDWKIVREFFHEVCLCYLILGQSGRMIRDVAYGFVYTHAYTVIIL